MERVSRTNQVRIEADQSYPRHLPAINCALFWAQKAMVLSKKTPLETHKSLPGQSSRWQSGSA